MRAFRAGDIEMRFDETDREILDRFPARVSWTSPTTARLTEIGGSYAVRSQVPPVTPKGILFLERLPIDEFTDRPGLFRFFGWL